ncbi:PAS domain-containing hybrid sensor histidine kinase/response regulator [Chelativorans sp. AA-79]|uniref:PAS domain-containing hybrid sensor histidine kinase/response regulator n=1 Tax=Chelativorans sp. AA-79 TaxID=3028735 RepID=UPI0023F740D1|nr:PAS domain-containing hybrid sensor histidine kinase/response regulator [Chelativorans sp. AA-79]WEX12011.1 PAS domain-containing hybrid sensor histidine kinase/response regulator [Chelativorans sp. AA-79]
MQGWVIAIIAIGYVTFLFVIASLGDRRAAAGRASGTRPLIYALSLAIYCTSWTFFGSVGLATERAFEFLTIYIGPVLVFVFANRLLGRIIKLAKREKITSVADFLAARYGKSFAIASVAALIATCGTIPYIALQLKAISASVSLMVEHYDGAMPTMEFFIGDISLLIAMLLALFAVLFGTRHADATEHQNGLVLAVAVESVIKLAAFLAVGVAVTFFLFGGAGELVRKITTEPRVTEAFAHPTSLATWVVMTTLSACAVIMLPRQFYVTIVENKGPDELRRAAWLFPLYLVLINLFVIPIAFAGLQTVGDRTNSDLYVLAVPLLAGHDALALVAFIGGLSAATAMVIVDSVALSIMISNDLIIPLFVRRLLHPESGEKEDWSRVILNIRRAAIFLILFAAFLYYRQSTNDTRLAAIGLISFAAIAQFAPAFLGGLIWRGANSRGALLGMGAGFSIWAYTLFFPSVAPPGTEIIAHGPFGIEALRPQALFGTIAEPLNHGVLWSLAVNMLFFVLGSLSRAAKPLERIQAAIFVPREATPMPSLRRFRPTVTVNDLKDTISRYLGVERTERSFLTFEAEQGTSLNGNTQASMPVIRFSEQLLTSAVGSSSARLILSLLFQRNDTAPRDAMKLLDDASIALQYNRDLLQTALDQMEEGITVFDGNFRLICWNRKFRVLFDLPDVMGQVGVSLGEIVDHLMARGELSRDTEKTVLERLAAFGTPWELTLRRSSRILEIRSNVMPGGGMVATYTDITARVAADMALKRANETLEQRVANRTAELTRVNEELAQAQMIAEEANLSKTRFLAAAGHDILQPLNAARLYCASLREKTDRQDLGTVVENVESSLDSVEAILGAVLDISRLDTGALKPSESAFRLDALLNQIRTDFQPLAAEKGLRLTIVPSSVAIRTDRNLFRRLVQNLVSNAIKYTRSGRVVVGVRRRGELAELQVIDTGIGIAGDKLNAVFREFTRLEEGMREAQGLGLGLSIVDRIARVLRLEIRLQSEPGNGTRFSVVLPVSAALPESLLEQAPPAVGPSVMLAGLNLLCIDNDEQILKGMRLLLEGWGCRVHTLSGLAALDALRIPGNRPDLILADYHLENGENGLSAVRRLRHAWGTEIPAVLITADRTGEVRAAAEAMGVSLLNKPIKPASLRALLMRYRQVLAAE